MAMMEFKSEIKYPLYTRLAMLPQEEADKITNAKTGGGRSLNAIHDSKLNSSEKHLLLFLGSQMNFTKNFVNQYRHISLNKIAEKISMTKQSILNLLNGYKKKGNKVQGLIEKGYVNKLIASKEDQEKGWSNHYCLTSKIFDEYIGTMIDEYNEESQFTPSQTVLPPQSNSLTTPSQMVLHNVPSIQSPSLNPSFNAAVQPAAKKVRPKTHKKKTWENKSEEERMDSVLNMTCDAHRLALEKDKRVMPYPFNDIPDLLNPLIKLHGLEAIKSFLDKRRDEKRGCNVRILKDEILRERDKKLDEPEPIVELEKRQEESQEKSFPDKGIQQMERNMSYDKKIIEENKDLILDDFPIEVQDWYRNISDSKLKRTIHKDFKMMTKDQFTAFVASIISRNKREDLFNANNNSISIGIG